MRDQIEKALYIARKDIKVYYLKAPNFTYGLLMPLALYLAFGASGNLSATTLISGLVSLVVLFGATSIEAVAVVSERTTGTFERLLVAPVTLRWILFGKALGGAAFGPLLAILSLVPIVLFSGAKVASPLAVFVAVAVSSFAFACFGIVASAYAKWIPEAQMYSNFLRFPMAFLGGAFISIESMPEAVRLFSRFLPLTYSIEALNEAMANPFLTGTYLVDIIVLVAFSVGCLFWSERILRKKLG
jgi:ABC-2 type transport system permease protein